MRERVTPDGGAHQAKAAEDLAGGSVNDLGSSLGAAVHTVVPVEHVAAQWPGCSSLTM